MDKDMWALLGILITNAGFLFGMWKYFDTRLNRVYARFDEHKEDVESIYVRKDNCSLLHTNTASTLVGLENRLEVRLDKIDKKLEEAFQMIIDLLKLK